jgi:hypothetical protein
MLLACLVSQIPGQPIIVARLTGSFTAADIDALYAEIADVARAFDGPYYRILDMSEMTANLFGRAKSTPLAAQGEPGTATDPRVIQNIYVGLADGFQIGLERIDPAARSKLDLSAVFNSLERALDYIYADMERALDARRSDHRADSPSTGANPPVLPS